MKYMIENVQNIHWVLENPPLVEYIGPVRLLVENSQFLAGYL